MRRKIKCFLTAKAAREIVGQSEVTHDKILADISDEVQRIAETGKSSFCFDPASHTYIANEFFKLDKLFYRSTEFTLKQCAVVKKIKRTWLLC